MTKAHIEQTVRFDLEGNPVQIAVTIFDEQPLLVGQIMLPNFGQGAVDANDMPGALRALADALERTLAQTDR